MCTLQFLEIEKSSPELIAIIGLKNISDETNVTFQLTPTLLSIWPLKQTKQTNKTPLIAITHLVIVKPKGELLRQKEKYREY